MRAHVFLCMLAYYIAKNRVRASGAENADFDVITELTPLQRRVFDLLGVAVNLYPETQNPKIGNYIKIKELYKKVKRTLAYLWGAVLRIFLPNNVRGKVANSLFLRNYEQYSDYPSSLALSTARNACCGTVTLPMARARILALPSFCFSRSLRLRVISPP